MVDKELLPWQRKVERAVKNGARYILLKCGRKTGKTEYIKYRMKKEAQEEPLASGQVNPYIAPSYRMAKNILWRRLKDQNKDEKGKIRGIPKDWLTRAPGETELIMDLKNGIRLQLFGADNEDSMRGLTFGPSKIDEADDIKPGVFQEVIEPNFAVTQAPCILAGTPKNRWFTKMWRDAKEGRFGRQYKAFHFTIYDNKYISKKYINKLKEVTPHDVFQQEYMANESAYSGLMYSEFKDSMIVPHREPKEGAMLIRSLDWGWEHPSHCLWGEVYFNEAVGRWNLYIYREWTGRGMNAEALCGALNGVESGKNFLFTVVDGSAKRTEMGTGQTILSQFHKYGLSCIVPMGKDDYRINAAKMLLQKGDVQVSERCPTLIRQFREVEWGQGKGEDAVDAYKYMASRFYEFDFATMKSEVVSFIPNNPMNGPIDPFGLLREKEEDQTFGWAEGLG